jgi:hypothetical protein
MDKYPKDFAPAFDESGGVATPFSAWWERIRCSYPDVPEDVAEQWLHRHWGHSPFGFLTSKRYSFSKERWPSLHLDDVASGANDWDLAKTLARGKYLCSLDTWLVRFMQTHKSFPVPIIVLDNRAGEIEGDPNFPAHRTFPRSHIVVEGHTRFELATWLRRLGQLESEVDVWVMRVLRGTLPLRPQARL